MYKCGQKLMLTSKIHGTSQFAANLYFWTGKGFWIMQCYNRKLKSYIKRRTIWFLMMLIFFFLQFGRIYTYMLILNPAQIKPGKGVRHADMFCIWTPLWITLHKFAFSNKEECSLMENVFQMIFYPHQDIINHFKEVSFFFFSLLLSGWTFTAVP